ncbi:MAG: exopolyphosphatase [Planctomycetota bacterium]
MTKPAATKKNPARGTPSRGPRPVAVIDIGTTSIRMAMAEIMPSGEVRPLDTLILPVKIGRDTFRSRRIERRSIEEVVDVLQQFKASAQEYGIQASDQIRVVATTAVREASNRMMFCDRIYIATGLVVEIIDEAEVNRITYLGIQQDLAVDDHLSNRKSVVVEVGGGSSEVLVIRNGNVLISESFRFGAVRWAERIEPYSASASQMKAVFENRCQRDIRRLVDHVGLDRDMEMIAIGGDTRFAARQLVDGWDGSRMARIAVPDLQTLADDVFGQDSDALVNKFGVTFLEADTLSAALYSYLALAQQFGKDYLYVSGTNLRDGLLHDMAGGGRLKTAFRNQIIRSAVTMGRKFKFDEVHAVNVADVAHNLFVELDELHHLEGRFEQILYVAALLHEIGLFIGNRGAHKHAMYLIRHSELFGLGKSELNLVSLVARYHRRATPQPTHEHYTALSRRSRVIVSKLAAILRLAIALCDSRSGRICEIQCVLSPGQLTIATPGVVNLSLETLAMRQNSSMFEEVFGRRVVLRSGEA